MNYDLDTYFSDLDEIADFMIRHPFETAYDLLKGQNDQFTDPILQTVGRALQFRISTIDAHDLARVRPLVDGMKDEVQKTKNIGHFIFTFDLQDRQREKEIRLRCKPYAASDPIFAGTDIWDRLTTNDQDLVEITRADEIDDEIIKIDGKYFRTDRGINTETIRLLKQSFSEFPGAKLWLRLASNEIYNKKPLKLLFEEAIIPANRTWWKQLKIYHNDTGQKAVYQNIDITLPENYDRYWDKMVRRIDKLQIEWHRKSSDLLTMMMEELPEMAVGEDKFKSSLLLHLTCRNKVGDAFEDATIEHIDGALNVYFGDSIALRGQSELSDKIDANPRTHLFRLENIPLVALLPLAYSFFKAKTLVKDWFKDQFNIK